MTYREYFQQHEEENISCCRPFTDDSETYYLIQYDGEIESAKTPDGTYHRSPVYGQRLDGSVIESIARAVNEQYDNYSGWTDEHIALEAMHEIGCAHCPFRDECEAMNEEMDS